MHIGVVGLGYWGAKHVRVLSGLPEVSRVTVCDVDPARTRDIAAAFPSVTLARDLRTLVSEVDAVVLATHASSHAMLAQEVLRRGRHVLVEKPLALSSRDAVQVIELASSLGLALMVGHTFAYNPAVRALADLVGSGGLGQVLHIDSQRLNLGVYQSDCDVIWDLAPHDVSILNLLVGSPPTSVRAWGRGHIDRAITDNAYLLLDYAGSGTQAAIHVSWLDPHKVRQITVVGSRRMAVYDDLADDARLRVYDKGVTVAPRAASHERPLTYRHGDIHCPYIPFEEPLQLEDQHFVDCIRTGREPLTNGRVALDVVQTLEAASLALAEGREVSLEEVGPKPAEIDLRESLARVR